MPGPHFDGHVPQPHFGGGFGGFHGFYGPNPINYIAPLIGNFATAPRPILNPNTNVIQMMTPGSWQLVNAGTPQQVYAWVPAPMGIWPLLSDVAPSKPAPAGPIKAIIGRRPIRAILGRLLRR